MQDPNAKPEPMPQQGAPAPQQGAPQGGEDPAVKAMMSVKDVLSSLQEIAPKGFPPEAQKLLATAASSFDGFLQIILGGKGGQAPAPAQAPQGAMAAGNKNAVPV